MPWPISRRPGEAHAAGLADRVGREVVVQQEALLLGALERVDVLLVLAGAEGGHDERLRLAAREERRAVRARQHVHLRDDRPNCLEIAAIDAPPLATTLPRMMSISSFLKAAARSTLRSRPPRRPGSRRTPSPWRRRQLVALLLLRRGECVLERGGRARGHLLLVLVGVELDVPRLLGRGLGELDDRLITGWKCLWPNMTASSIVASGSSLASDSTIITASCVPATTRSSALSAISSIIGLSTSSPPMTPTRAAPIGPRNGARQRERGGGRHHPENVGSFSMSCESTVTMTCVSFLKPSTNSGRIGRSMRREVSVSFSVGRPSRLK